MFHTTSDGTIRISEAELASLRLCHESSGLYLEREPEVGCGRPTELVGFTEWLAEDAQQRVVTLSWDWRIDPSTGECAMDGLPYSNIELVDESGATVAWRPALTRLARHLESIDWARSVRSAIE